MYNMIVYILVLLVFLLEPVVAEDVLIFSDARRRDVFKMDLSGGRHVAIGNQSWSSPAGIGVDLSDNNVFVIEQGSLFGNKSIVRFNVDNESFKRKILPRESEPDGIAVDHVSRLVYYTDACYGNIAVTDFDFTWHRVIYRQNLDKPRAIAVHPTAGRMFWTDWGQRSPHIGRAFMDGSKPEVILNRFVGWPNGLYVDTQRDELFWCDARTFRVERSSLDGSNRRVIVRRPGEHFFGIVADENFLYWTAWNQPAVQRAPRTGSERPESLGQRFSPNTVRLTGLTITKDSLRSMSRNACSGRGRGGCQQLCLPVGTSRVCACSDGLQIQNDNVSCQRFTLTRGLVFTDVRRRGVFVLDLGQAGSKPTRISDSFGDPRGIIFDPQERKVYWSDAARRSISSASLHGSSVTVIRRFNRTDSNPEGLALDVAGKMLYVVDAGRGVILRVPTTGSREDVLVRRTNARQRFRSIVLDVAARRMYWTDWGTPAVWAADLDGQRPRMVVSEDLGWPNGLAIDLNEKSLYWVDGLLKRIERVRVDGTERKVLFGNPLLHPAGLTLGQRKIYFSVINTAIGSVYEVDRQNVTRAIPVRGVYHGRVYSLDFLSASTASTTRQGSPPPTSPTTPSPARNIGSSVVNRAISRPTTAEQDSSTVRTTSRAPPEPLAIQQQETGAPSQTEPAPVKSTSVSKSPTTELPVILNPTPRSTMKSTVTELPTPARAALAISIATKAKATSTTPYQSTLTERPISTRSSPARTPAQSPTTVPVVVRAETSTSSKLTFEPTVRKVRLNSEVSVSADTPGGNKTLPAIEQLTFQKAVSGSQSRGTPWPVLLAVLSIGQMLLRV